MAQGIDFEQLDNVAFINGNDIKPQKPSPEELRQLLSSRCLVGIPERKMFFEKNVNEAINFFNDRTLIELDVLFLDLDKNNEDEYEKLVEFFMFTPEYRSLMIRLHNLVSVFFQIIKPRLFRAFKTAFKPKGIDMHPIGEVLYRINSVAISLVAKSPHAVIRNKFVCEFVTFLFERITLELNDIARNLISSSNSRISKQQAEMFFELLGRAPIMKDLKGLDYHVQRLKKTINALYPDNFREILLQADKDDTAMLKDEADDKMEIIRDLAPLFSFNVQYKNWDKSRMELYCVTDRISGEARANILFQLRIIVNPDCEIQKNEASLYYEGGMPMIRSDVGNSFFDISLDYCTGEFFIFRGVPFSQVLNKLDYLKFKNVIFDAIIECLAQEEKKTTCPLMDNVNDVKGEINHLLPNDTCKCDLLKREDVEDENGFVYRKRLKGLKGNIVLNALDVLVERVRTSGSSHFIYKCRNGGTYPISIHGGEEVGTGMLLTVLKRLGVSYKEFCLQIK
jgi:predicted RNA binding protein YcfA (HicA-like mRNA interferase family)